MFVGLAPKLQFLPRPNEFCCLERIELHDSLGRWTLLFGNEFCCLGRIELHDSLGRWTLLARSFMGTCAFGFPIFALFAATAQGFAKLKVMRFIRMKDRVRRHFCYFSHHMR